MGLLVGLRSFILEGLKKNVSNPSLESPTMATKDDLISDMPAYVRVLEM